MNNLTTLYHGSEATISELKFGAGNPYNDYGLGFYTTPTFSMAAEWAVPTAEKDGYVNEYELSLDGLSILYLDEQPFEYWVSILLQNRGGRFNREVSSDIKRFIQKYPFNISDYDVICGHRADDAYFSFIRDFCLNILSLENLKKAMYLGNLGQQYCLLSQKAFNATKFICAQKVLAADYHKNRVVRDDEARDNYWHMENKRTGTLLLDIIGR